VLDQRIKSGVLGDDVKAGTWITLDQLTDVVRDMEIEGI